MSHIAICCQGGGSHTAFTGGALGPLYCHARTLADRVTVTGTSGGALCAAVAATASDPTKALEALWEDTKASGCAEAWLNFLTASASFFLPLISPYTNPYHPAQALRRLIDKHVQGKPRNCLISACNVLSGEFVLFRDGEIGTDHLLASCSMPYLFPATLIDGQYYWDGGFANNQPIAGLFDLEDKPDQIWVIRIDPKARARLPVSAGDIADRSKELGYANALEHELASIARINRWLDKGIVLPGYRQVTVRQITLGLNLDNATKLDRSPALIDALFAAGQAAAQSFISSLNH
jgi:NTE family protein